VTRSILLAGALIALIGSADAALACKCAVTSRAAAMSSAPVVFEGRVLNIASSGSGQVTRLTVVRAIKGVASGATVTVRSITSRGRCGWDFRTAGKTLLVGGQRAGGALSVSRCTMYNLNN
jgi:hypothetical protein